MNAFIARKEIVATTLHAHNPHANTPCLAGKWTSIEGFSQVDDCEGDFLADKWSSLVDVSQLDDCDNLSPAGGAPKGLES